MKYGDPCFYCDSPLWAPISIERGYCEYCRLNEPALVHPEIGVLPQSGTALIASATGGDLKSTEVVPEYDEEE